ncbi:predicted protein [Histoplasma capsulatum H143]|uniref:Uncharacterized protein n=1 Tax=Ajellomyces capsulatus (strain H143) TaxID=544712 RepID=C6H9M2_AJECH|nr:predicted protein [Histoplasma capsulatum H143]
MSSMETRVEPLNQRIGIQGPYRLDKPEIEEMEMMFQKRHYRSLQSEHQCNGIILTIYSACEITGNAKNVAGVPKKLSGINLWEKERGVRTTNSFISSWIHFFKLWKSSMAGLR